MPGASDSTLRRWGSPCGVSICGVFWIAAPLMQYGIQGFKTLLHSTLARCSLLMEDGKKPRLFEHLGFEVDRRPRPLPAGLHDSLENPLIYAPVWAFYPGQLKRCRAKLECVQGWISREELIARITTDSTGRTPFPTLQMGSIPAYLADGRAAAIKQTEESIRGFSLPSQT